MKDGRSFEQGVADLFNLTVPDYTQEKFFSVFINSLVLNREGKCIRFYGTVYDERISTYFPEESIHKEMTEKLNTWVKEQTFDTKRIPRGFDGYSFKCIVSLK